MLLLSLQALSNRGTQHIVDVCEPDASLCHMWKYSACEDQNNGRRQEMRRCFGCSLSALGSCFTDTAAREAAGS
ncbi:hypothetical protein EYF80_051027 [Liparis tanakae]|uniref:Uncharacterized protein n=1 Tax=Liparis tanakae TaxID=230148 RepID=A0A4Z2FCW0_9TELE|nr:hypothetical protein EYF80_051027 [Liparis tanakae]